MGASFIDQIVSHLELLGFQIKEKEGWFSCQHKMKKRLIFGDYAGGILLRSQYRSNNFAKENISDILIYLNKLNRETIVTRFYLNKEVSIIANAWFPGIYDERQFGSFMDLWEYDTMELLLKSEPETSKYLGSS